LILLSLIDVHAYQKKVLPSELLHKHRSSWV